MKEKSQSKKIRDSMWVLWDLRIKAGIEKEKDFEKYYRARTGELLYVIKSQIKKLSNYN